MSRDMVYEDVPRVSRRVGDNVVAGSNNSTIILGRDRLGRVDTGYGAVTHPDGGKSAGAMHLVVGRIDEDPSIEYDAATVYLSERNDPDDTAGTHNIGPAASRKSCSAVIIRADCIRVVPRKDFMLVVGTTYVSVSERGVTIDGDISLGEGAADRVMKGDAFMQFWNTVVVPTPAGPSGPLPPIPESVFSSRSKVK